MAHAHLRYLNPFPKNLGDILNNYKKVLIPEINNGQLVQLIKSKYLIPAEQFNKIQGTPITRAEMIAMIKQTLG